MPDLKSVKEIARGTDWVKFLAVWEPGVVFGQIRRWHDGWSRKNAQAFGCGVAEVMPFNFNASGAVFKFRTEPYSMKSNDCFRYIDAFQKHLKGPGVSEASGTTSAEEKPAFDTKSVVDDIIDGLKNIRIAGIDFGKPEKDLVIDMTPYAGKFVRSDGVNVPSCRTAGGFRTTNDVRVKSLISRLKAK